LSISGAARGLLWSIHVALTLVAVAGLDAWGQAVPAAEMDELAAITAAASDSGPVGIIPVTRGFNASLGTTSQHDSSNGWSSLLMPNIAYRFNRHFSVDAGVPVYLYINIDANVGTKAKPRYAYSPKKDVFGDTTLLFEADESAFSIDYAGVFSLGLPSGNTAYGLGAGQVTYNLNNHFEKNFGRFTPNIELGYGDTSRLVDQRVQKSYVAVGHMAHFQAGASVDLARNMTFEADAYEELPLAKDLVYSTTGKGKKKVTTATNIAQGEDNGFLTSLDIPLAPHMVLSGFYSRSLRDRDDLGGFSLTFLLKAPPRMAETGR
jgi:hypothetical protein